MPIDAGGLVGLLHSWSQMWWLCSSPVTRCRQVASTLHETTADADYVISSLPFSSIVEETVDELIASNAVKEGTVWVDTTSGVPSVSSRIWSKLDAVGVNFLDCGVAGGPNAAEKGILSAMVGGESRDLVKAQPLLDCMMAKVVHIGPVGSGHAVKAVNNTLLATNIWTTYEGLIILARMGVDLEKALDAINCSSGRRYSTKI
jgi:3-hydroxyisobutyrate dehydrogenase